MSSHGLVVLLVVLPWSPLPIHAGATFWFLLVVLPGLHYQSVAIFDHGLCMQTRRLGYSSQTVASLVQSGRYMLDVMCCPYVRCC